MNDNILDRETVLRLIWQRDSLNPDACDNSLDKHDDALRAELKAAQEVADTNQKLYEAEVIWRKGEQEHCAMWKARVAEQPVNQDTARLDWLEALGFSTVRNGRGEGPVTDPGVHSWRDIVSQQWRWTAAWISYECPDVRTAIDMAMKGCRAEAAEKAQPEPVSEPYKLDEAVQGMVDALRELAGRRFRKHKNRRTDRHDVPHPADCQCHIHIAQRALKQFESRNPKGGK